MKARDRIELRVTNEDMRRWRVQAAQEDMSLSAWIRQCCNAEARRPPDATRRPDEATP